MDIAQWSNGGCFYTTNAKSLAKVNHSESQTSRKAFCPFCLLLKFDAVTFTTRSRGTEANRRSLCRCQLASRSAAFR